MVSDINQQAKKRSLWSRFLRFSFYPYPDSEVRVAWLVKPHQAYSGNDDEHAVDESFGYYGMAVKDKPLPLVGLSDQLWADFRAGWPHEDVVQSSKAWFGLSFIIGLWLLVGWLWVLVGCFFLHEKDGIWSPMLLRLATALPAIGVLVMACGYFSHRKGLSEERKVYLESFAGAFKKEGFTVDYGRRRLGYHYVRFRRIDGSKFDHRGDRLRLNGLGHSMIVIGLIAFILSALFMIFSGISMVQVIDDDLDGYHGLGMNRTAKAAEYNSIRWSPVVLKGTLFELKYENPDYDTLVKLIQRQRDKLGAQNLILSQAFSIGAYFSMLLFFISFCRMPRQWDGPLELSESERKKRCINLRQFHVLVTVFSWLWAVFLVLYQFSFRSSEFCGPVFVELPFDLDTSVGTNAIIHDEISVHCKMGFVSWDIIAMSWLCNVVMMTWWLMDEEWGVLSADHDVATNDDLTSLVGRLSLMV